MTNQRASQASRAARPESPAALFLTSLGRADDTLRVAVGDRDGDVVSRGVLVVTLDAGSSNLNPLDYLLVVTESPYTGGHQLAHVEFDRDRSTRDDDRRVASCFWHKFSPWLMRLTSVQWAVGRDEPTALSEPASYQLPRAASR